MEPESKNIDYDALYAECRKYKWEFSQMFGEEESDSEASDSESEEGSENQISALSFDPSGNFLAVGYHSGQVVVLQQQNDEQTYQLYTEFKSHDSEFDFLTSMEIEEKIGVIKWYPFHQARAQRLLTTNDKTIKLFKVDTQDEVVKKERVFQGGHTYNINGISFNCDGETFISTDDLRINLWNLEVNEESFNIVDIKPDNMDDLVEIITSSALNPKDSNHLIYGTNRGLIRFKDMRESSLCDTNFKEFEDPSPEVTGFFQEMVSSVSHLEYSPCGRYIASRDYLSLKIWDPRYEGALLKSIPFHSDLTSRLYNMYENECIFDKFEFTWSPDSTHLLTGSYSNSVYICEAFGDQIEHIKLTRPGETRTSFDNHFNPNQKVLKVSWNPVIDSIVLGAKDFGYLYKKVKK